MATPISLTVRVLQCHYCKKYISITTVPDFIGFCNTSCAENWKKGMYQNVLKRAGIANIFAVMLKGTSTYWVFLSTKYNYFPDTSGLVLICGSEPSPHVSLKVE